MRDEKRAKGYLTSIIALVFMIIGYQTALFVHHAAVMKITANRDEPDTVYIIRTIQEDDMGSMPESKTVVRRNSVHSERAQDVRNNVRRSVTESFSFNPNTVSEEDLCRLGFTPKQARSIISYRDKGGRFRRKSDFAKSFVVADSVYKRLEPYIDIPLIDLNLADSATFDTLPGIGGWYASKMVSYRKELRGYSYKEQLLDIWKFDKEKYDALSDLITIDPKHVKPYPLWSYPADSLRLHPYIRNYETARAIVLFRETMPKEQWTVKDLENAGILSQEASGRLSHCDLEVVR